MDKFIKSKNLNKTFPYWDDIIIGGKDQHKHDINLRRFIKAAETFGMSINKSNRHSLKRKSSSLNILLEI